jgi:hypothetical protein
MKWTCLKGNDELIDELTIIKKRLEDALLIDEKRHLADVGCILSFLSEDLKNISKKAFKLHEQQKQ